MIAMPVTAALVAYDSTKNTAAAAGVSDKASNASAAKAALVAGGATAAVGIGISAALGMAAKAGPNMIGRLIPYVGEGLMAAGAVEGAKKHGAAGAVFGAVGADALLDLPMSPKQMAAEVNPLVDTFNEALGQPKWGKGDFTTADAAYRGMRAAAERSTTTLRGWREPYKPSRHHRQSARALVALTPHRLHPRRLAAGPQQVGRAFSPEQIDVEKERRAHRAAADYARHLQVLRAHSPIELMAKKGNGKRSSLCRKCDNARRRAMTGPTPKPLEQSAASSACAISSRERARGRERARSARGRNSTALR